MEALEKIFGFLQGQPYRLILFGGRREIFVDDAERYRNDGQWTDFYSALVKAREVMATYPPRTEFRMILLTDALFDPKPEDWADLGVPPEASTSRPSPCSARWRWSGRCARRSTSSWSASCPAGSSSTRPSARPRFILDLVEAANGAQAGPTAQTLASFFDDNGVLLKKFIFRASPEQGLKQIEPVVKRITAPPRPWVELKFLSVHGAARWCSSSLLLLGILVRAFPGPGDLEVVELDEGRPVHVAVDRLHKLDSGGWGSSGLSLVAEPKEAAATLRLPASTAGPERGRARRQRARPAEPRAPAPAPGGAAAPAPSTTRTTAARKRRSSR